MCESKQGVKGNIYFCKIFHCRTCSAGQQCDCTVSRANGSGSSKYSRMLLLARTRFRCSASPADATSALALDKHCLRFVCRQPKREGFVKKKKKEVFLDLHFSSSFLKSLLSICLFFTIIIPSQRSMMTVRDAWRAKGWDRFWHGANALRHYVCVFRPRRLATCQLDAPAKRRRKWNCRPFISNASNSKPFSSPHHLGLPFIFSSLSPARLTVNSFLFFAGFTRTRSDSGPDRTVNAPLRNNPPS